MDHQIRILNFLYRFKEISFSYQEGWGNIELEGNYDESVYSLIKEFDNILSELGIKELAKYWFDSDNVNISDFADYESNESSFFKWRLTFNKQGLVQKSLNGDDYNYNIFLTDHECTAWLNNLNPLDEKNPVNKYSPLKIVICDLSIPMGNDLFGLLPADQQYCNYKFSDRSDLPKFDTLQEHIHFICEFKVGFDPNTYAVKDCNYQSELGQSLLKQSTIALIACIVDEYYELDKVIINGLKRMSLQVCSAPDRYDYTLIHNLIELVHWLYDDKIETRKKLFNERLTLEIQQSETLVKGLTKHLTESLEQAKSRYNFVILERKDAYLKELKDLLKDIRIQSDLYSQKIRALLSNFLRDILAALILVGFTIFTKFSDNIGLNQKHLIEYVFNALAVYFIISIVFQALVDISDLWITNKEIRFWKKASKELISDVEFNQYYTGSLRARKTSIWLLYPLIGILYVFIAFLCYKYPVFLDTILIKKN